MMFAALARRFFDRSLQQFYPPPPGSLGFIIGSGHDNDADVLLIESALAKLDSYFDSSRFNDGAEAMRLSSLPVIFARDKAYTSKTKTE